LSIPQIKGPFDTVDSNLRIAICYSLGYPTKTGYKNHQEVDRLTIDVDHEDAVLRTFILFVQTARAVLKYTDADLYRKARLSIIKLIVLRALASNSRVMTPSEIAEWTQTERHNITALIGRMRRDGLVAAERNSSDKRFVNITLTDKGREALNRATPVAKEIVDQVMSSIDEGDAALLDKYLRTLRENAYDGLGNVAKHSQRKR
jgi:DNA-binding MarR family transcriptional regulator